MDIPCSQCKYADATRDQFPCCVCKGTADPCSYDYLRRMNFYEPDAKSTEAGSDPVSHPAHYASSKFECIDVMAEAIGLEDVKGFCLCNAFKYIYRCTRKHKTPVEDVEKAIWYLNKFLELEKGRDAHEAGLLGEPAAPGQPQKGPF